MAISVFTSLDSHKTMKTLNWHARFLVLLFLRLLSNNYSAWELQANRQSVNELFPEHGSSLLCQCLLNIFVHVIPSSLVSLLSDITKLGSLTHAFISSMVSFFFSSSTLYVEMFLFCEKPTHKSQLVLDCQWPSPSSTHQFSH